MFQARWEPTSVSQLSKYSQSLRVNTVFYFQSIFLFFISRYNSSTLISARYGLYCSRYFFFSLFETPKRHSSHTPLRAKKALRSSTFFNQIFSSFEVHGLRTPYASDRKKGRRKGINLLPRRYLQHIFYRPLYQIFMKQVRDRSSLVASPNQEQPVLRSSHSFQPVAFRNRCSVDY